MKKNWLFIVSATLLFCLPVVAIAEPLPEMDSNMSVQSLSSSANVNSNLGTTMGSSSESSSDLAFGVKVGANVSNVYDSEGEAFQADPKLGFVVGVFLSIPLGSILGFQPEILFSQKGFQGAGSIFGNEYSFTRTANYIDVPLLLTLRASNLIKLLVGPQYSYLVSQKYTFNSDLINLAQEDAFENENIRKNTFCLTGGVDVELEDIVIGARIGFDVLNNNGDGTSTTPQYKNVWYQATIGFKF